MEEAVIIASIIVKSQGIKQKFQQQTCLYSNRRSPTNNEATLKIPPLPCISPY